tara:strand:- start:1057 stop:2385 length:1329 start_codon:yes stop_codon:yes gene_type:complete
MKNKIKLLSLIIIMLFHVQAYSEELSYKTIDDYNVFNEDSFYSYIQQIVITQPEFLESVSKQKEINEDRKFATRLRFPTITASLVNDESISRDVSDNLSLRKRQDDSFDGVISLDQPLYVGGSINSKVKIAKARLKKSKEELNSVASELIITAVEIYLETVKADMLSSFAKKELDKLLIFREQIEKRFQAGAVDSSEKALVNIRLSELEAQEAILKSKKIQQLAVYQSFFKETFVNQGLPQIEIQSVNNNQGYYSKRLSYEEKIAKLEIENQEYQVNLTKSNYRPKLGVSLKYKKYDLDDNQSKDEDIRGGVYFSVPLLNFGRGTAEINASKARLHQSKVNYDRANRDVDYQIASAQGNVVGLNEARNKILSSLKNIRIQKKNLELRLSSGSNFTAVTIIDVTNQEVDILRQLLDTEQTLMLSELRSNHLETSLLSRFKIAL